MDAGRGHPKKQRPVDRAQLVRELCRRHEAAVREARTWEAMGFLGRALPFKREAVELAQEIRSLVPEAFETTAA